MRPETFLGKPIMPCFAAVVLLLAVLGCSDKGENTTEAEDTAHKIQNEKHRLAQEYNGIDNWKESLPHLTPALSYSFEMKRALMPSDPRPIVFSGRIEDIDEHDGAYVITFSDLEGGLYFKLNATADQVASIASNPRWEQVVIAARVTGVELSPYDEAPQRLHKYLVQGTYIALRPVSAGK